MNKFIILVITLISSTCFAQESFLNPNLADVPGVIKIAYNLGPKGMPFSSMYSGIVEREVEKYFKDLKRFFEDPATQAYPPQLWPQTGTVAYGEASVALMFVQQSKNAGSWRERVVTVTLTSQPFFVHRIMDMKTWNDEEYTGKGTRLQLPIEQGVVLMSRLQSMGFVVAFETTPKATRDFPGQLTIKWPDDPSKMFTGACVDASSSAEDRKQLKQWEQEKMQRPVEANNKGKDKDNKKKK